MNWTTAMNNTPDTPRVYEWGSTHTLHILAVDFHGFTFKGHYSDYMKMRSDRIELERFIEGKSTLEELAMNTVTDQFAHFIDHVAMYGPFEKND